MKKHLKILLVAACIALLAGIFSVMVLADSTIEQDATLESAYVSTGGDVKLSFVYTSFGSATEIVAEIYAPGANEAETTYVFTVADLTDNTVTVPLAPSQMDYTVSVYAKDEAGKTGAARAYSVRQYANDVLAREDLAQYHNSMRTLLNWGAMADSFFNGGESGINEGVFTRNSNPVADLNSSFFGEETTPSTSTNAEVIKASKLQLHLEPGKTVMTFHFEYKGENAKNITATVSRDGVEPVEVPVRVADGEYLVNINNVGVAVFDKAYTVTITDGEHTATATKAAVEYLNYIAFNTANSEANRNLAKSMYQFFTQAMVADNKLDLSACQHESGFYTRDAGDGVNENVVCSNCFAVVDTFPAALKYYSYSSDVTYFNQESGNNNTINQPIVEDGVRFIRAAARTDNVNVATNMVQRNLELGKYLIVKYRAMNVATDAETGEIISHIQLRVNINDKAVKASTIKAALVEGEWAVAVVDISGVTGYAEAVAAGKAENLHVEFWHTCTLDLAYVGMADSLGGFEGILEEGETIDYRKEGFSTIGNQIAANGSCVGNHAIKTTTQTNENDKVYSYACSKCDTLFEQRTVANDIIYYTAQLQERSAGTANVTVKGESGIVYASSTPASAEANADVILPYAAPETHGKYVAIKYRVSEGASVSFNMMTGGKGNAQGALTTHPGEWTVVIMDVSGLNGYNATAGGALYWYFQHNGTLDIAYVAMSDNLDSLRALLADGETYMYRGAGAKPFANIAGQAEVEKNGTCITHNGGTATCGTLAACMACGESYGELGAHASGINVVKTADADKTIFSYVCGNTGCPGVADAKEVPASVGFYADLSKIVPQGATSKVTMKVDENGMPYASAEWLSGTGNILMQESGEHGKYLVVKYRVNSPVKEGESNSLRLQPYLNGQSNKYTTNTNNELDKWTVAVVDISGLAGYDASQKNYFCFSHTSTLDIAYVAMADTLEGVATLLDEGESFYFRNNDFAYLPGVEYNDEAENVRDRHNVTYTTTAAADGKTTYTYTCNCKYCNNKPIWQKTLDAKAATVDITGVETTGMAWMEVDAGVFPYAHVETFGKQTTTTFSTGTQTVTAGSRVFMKWRVNDGSPAVANDFAVDIYMNGIKVSKSPNATVPASSMNSYYTGDWVVGQIDISSLMSSAGVSVGSQVTLEFRITHTDDLDVAYFVTYDAVTIRTELVGGENPDMVYYTQSNVLGSYNGTGKKRNASGATNIPETNTCTHVLKTITTVCEGYTTYTFTCSTCQATLAPRRVIYTDEMFFMYGTKLAAKNSVTLTTGTVDAENKVPYRGVYLKTTSTANSVVSATLENSTIGEYVAIKYRVPNAPSDPTAYVRFDFNLNGKAVLGGQVIRNHVTEDWVVAIIYIGDNNVYKDIIASGETTATVDVTFQNSSKDAELQICYVAMGSLTQLQGLLADGETYMDRGQIFTNVEGQIECNKDGTPVTQ